MSRPKLHATTEAPKAFDFEGLGFGGSGFSGFRVFEVPVFRGSEVGGLGVWEVRGLGGAEVQLALSLQ